MKITRYQLIFGFFSMLTCIVSADQEDRVDGHFSSWENVPTLIDSINKDEYSDQLKELHDITRIKLGYPQASLNLGDEEHEKYMMLTKQKWEEWWESTGKPISKLKKQNSIVDLEAFQTAWDFMGRKQEQPKAILPVWIPKTWSLYVTYGNGDYFGREKELWIINRQAEKASLTRLRGDYHEINWRVGMSAYSDFSVESADHFLKALCYLNRYAPNASEKVADNELSGLYYPHATLSLRDGENQILWNTEGHNFLKTRNNYGNGDSGRSYYFLRTLFSNKENWKEIVSPVSKDIEAYRLFLSNSKPYFSSMAMDVIQFFGQYGGSEEKKAMLEWAGKEKAATDPKMSWEVLTGYFGTGHRVNVINSTRFDIQGTLKQLKMIGDRLSEEAGVEVFDGDRSMEKELEDYVLNMLEIQKREEAEAIASFDQPLRNLIIASEHPNDSDLKHLSAAVQAIRKAPDPELFSQLAQEMNENSLRMGSFLENILHSENNYLDLEAWEEPQEKLAVEACINSLRLVKGSAKIDWIKILLVMFGGGEIEIEVENETEGRRIEVIIAKNGSSYTYGSASDPLSLAEAQKELRRLYLKSKEE